MSHVPHLVLLPPGILGRRSVLLIGDVGIGDIADALASAQTTAPPASAQGASKLDAMPKALQKIDVKQGAGAEAVNGKAGQ